MSQSSVLCKRTGIDLLFFCSSHVDEVWIRSTAHAARRFGYSAFIAIADDASSLSVEKEVYLAAGIAFEDSMTFSAAAAIPARIVITASSGIDRTLLPTKARFLVHMPHSLASLHMIYPSNAFHGYDVLFSCGPHHDAEFQEICARAGLKDRHCLPVGYGKLDVLKEALLALPERDSAADKPHILVAPSWGAENLLEYIGPELVQALLAMDWLVTVRPHPLLIIENAPVMGKLRAIAESTEHFKLEMDLVSNHAMLTADLLIGDYSGTAFEFAALRGKPVVSVDLGRKVVNPDWETFDSLPVEIAKRKELGTICPPRIPDIIAAVQDQLARPAKLKDAVDSFLHVPPGDCAEIACRAIGHLLKDIPMPKRAIILAAGSGSRLMPYTQECPKGMVPLAGRPLLDRQISVLRDAGIDDVVLIGGYRASQLARYECPIVINPDYASTNMVASLNCARQYFDGTHDIVICYSDIVYEPSVIENLLQDISEITVAADRNWRALWSARMENPLADVESFRVDAQGRVVELGRKVGDTENIQGQYIGLVSVPATAQSRFFDLYDNLDPSGIYEDQPFRNLYLTGYLQMLIESGWTVAPAWIENGWLEIDTVQDLRRYHCMLEEGQLTSLINLDCAGGQTIPMRDLFKGMEAFIASRVVENIASSDTIFDTAAFVATLFVDRVPNFSQLVILDRLSRKIEITNRLCARYHPNGFQPIDTSEHASPSTIEALLALMLAHFASFGDLRHLNTVVKALHGPLMSTHEMTAHPDLLAWCDQAIAHLEI